MSLHSKPQKSLSINGWEIRRKPYNLTCSMCLEILGNSALTIHSNNALRNILLKTKTPVKCFQEQHHCLHEDNWVLIIYSPWNIQDCWCGGEQEEVVICLWFYFQEGKALFLKRDYKGHFPVGWFFYYFFFFFKKCLWNPVTNFFCFRALPLLYFHGKVL